MRFMRILLGCIMVFGAMAVAVCAPTVKDVNRLYDGRSFNIPELGATVRIISISPVARNRYTILVEAQ